MFSKPNRSHDRRPSILYAAILPLLVCIGCQNNTRMQTDPRTNATARTALRDALPIFDRAGDRVDWIEMIRSAQAKDVVIIGEQHDDATGHAVEQAVVEDAVARWPDTALSMEMLDRRRQSTADDYIAGIINRDEFLEEIATTKFRSVTRSYLDGEINRATFEERIFALGWPDWPNNYQPIIDVARSFEMPVIASNTPWRRYGSLANKEGFERLAALTPAQRALVEVPEFLPEGTYRERFWKVMGGGSNGMAAEKPSPHGKPGENSSIIDGAFRAQCVMDATMADSIADALNTRTGRIIHLVGQFHSDFMGGTVQQLLHLRPKTRVMTISMQAVESETLREEDRDRADFVIYTGGDAR
ncbi:MAG: ChaN family lipoprotein [Phycisphaerales bacterium]|nr:ChaN family lipoprotein [Phycisphaerales bacterium]